MVLLFVAAVPLIWLSYYFAFGSRKPLFIGGKGRLRNLLNRVSSEAGVYSATPWSYGGHLHTIFAHILKKRPRVNYLSEDLHTADGGVLKLDWTLDPKKGKIKDLVLILPGLTGTSHEKYVLHFVRKAQKLGYQAVVMNYRGSFGAPKTYRFNCASNSEDLEFVLEHINKCCPESRVCAVGVSLGGIILTNHLTTHPNSPLHACLVVSIPWDLFCCSTSLEKPVTWLLFNRYLTRKLQTYFRMSIEGLKAQNVNVPNDVCTKANKANSIREFDDAVIAPMFGYLDVNEYYTAASPSKKSLESIKIPLLCLNAADDPFSPHEQIPVERIKNCENVAMVLTQTGGHVGFLEGLWSTDNGYMTRVFEEYIKGVFQEL